MINVYNFYSLSVRPHREINLDGESVPTFNISFCIRIEPGNETIIEKKF